ncbi:hypothetical protein D3C76_01780 [compost metagenome]
METTTVMVKFESGAEYKDVAAAAKKLGIAYVGVKKPALIDAVNAKIDRLESGEDEAPAAPVVAEQPNNDNNEQKDNADQPSGKDNGQQPGNVAPKTAAATTRQTGTPRAKGAKWYETTAPKYNTGDIVNIIAGPCLVGRKAEITQPSAKKDAMKCKLINPKDGTLQGTEITMDYYKLELFQAAGTSAPEAVEAEEKDGAEPASSTENPDGNGTSENNNEGDANTTSEEKEVVVVDEQPVVPTEDDKETDEEHSA